MLCAHTAAARDQVKHAFAWNPASKRLKPPSLKSTKSPAVLHEAANRNGDFVCTWRPFEALFQQQEAEALSWSLTHKSSRARATRHALTQASTCSYNSMMYESQLDFCVQQVLSKLFFTQIPANNIFFECHCTHFFLILRKL